ncbi:MAG: RNA methyltransferase [Rhodospirillales bacterium]
MDLSDMRGYFGIGIEGVSKAMNIGSLLRTAHAFDAAFVFTVGAAYQRRKGEKADTSRTQRHVPFYSFPDHESMMLPHNCALVGVELTENAVDLPVFRHPPVCAYVLGPERGSLSPAMLARCAHVVRIPTKFALNVALAGALVMYDRLRTRPAPADISARAHVRGAPKKRTPQVAGGGGGVGDIGGVAALGPDLTEWSPWRDEPPPVRSDCLADFLGEEEKESGGG